MRASHTSEDSSKNMSLVHTSGPLPTSGGPLPGKRTFAVVIKGPMLDFTVDIIDFYARELEPKDQTLVVFSHNLGPCLKPMAKQQIQDLAKKYPDFFAYVLKNLTSIEGQGHRNVQREAVYYGALYAKERYDVDYIFMQRQDMVFMDAARLLGELRSIHESLPSPAEALPGGRLGTCPIQLQFNKQYGQYHLDDHCMFGRPESILDFWSLSNRFYNSSAVSWSSKLGNWRKGCGVPATESDNGFIWTMDLVERGFKKPRDTVELIASRMWLINPEHFHYMSRRKRGHQRLSLPVNLSDAPHLNVLRLSVREHAAPYGPAKLCRAVGGLIDCSQVPDVWGRLDSPKWACSASNTRCR